MKLSMSTCATERRRGENGFVYDFAAGLKKCADSGFEVVDFNFAHAAKKTGFLAEDNWEQQTDALAEKAKQFHLTIGQTHSHWFHPSDARTPELLAWNEEMIRRSILATAWMQKNAWVVMHPRSVFDAEGFNYEKSMQQNYDELMRFGDLAAKCGTRIAVENLFTDHEMGCCCNGEDLMSLMERLPGDVFGICWDFGHANREKLDSVKELEIVASRLKVTHCHDNKGRSDDHFIPFFGSVPWRAIMPKLKEIGYTGNLNMEVHVFYNTLPQTLLDRGLGFMKDVGAELIRMFENA